MYKREGEGAMSILNFVSCKFWKPFYYLLSFLPAPLSLYFPRGKYCVHYHRPLVPSFKSKGIFDGPP